MKKLLLILILALAHQSNAFGAQTNQAYQTYSSVCGEQGVCIQIVELPGSFRMIKKIFRVDNQGRETRATRRPAEVTKWLKKPAIGRKVEKLSRLIIEQAD